MSIVIVDYGMGNIKSITGALKFICASNIELSSDYNVLKKADKIILPGVGSFGKAMANIRHQKLDSYLKELVIEQRKPILGICLGMQLLGISSTEDGYNEGLGFVNGEVRKFDDTLGIKIPHVGFNQIKANSNTRLFYYIGKDFYFYFINCFLFFI
jgi:glutamine amidotransferase